MIQLVRISLLLCLLFATLAKGQNSDLLFQHLTINNGLSQATNPYIYRDSKGFVWLSSLYGLNRFDGQSVKVYKSDPTDSMTLLSENIQSSFFEDKETNLWFTTYESVNVYVRAHDNFQHFSLKDSLNQAVLGYYAFYLDNQAQLWLLAGDEYICTFNLKTQQFQKRYWVGNATQRAVAITNQTGQVERILSWSIQSEGLKLTTFKNEQPINSITKFKQPSDKSFQINDVCVENETIIWLSTNKGLGRYNCKTEQLSLYMPPLKVKNISSAAVFDESSLIISINGEGIWLFDKYKNEFKIKATTQNNALLSITNNNGKHIIKDSKNSFWLSTSGIGVDFTYPQKRKFALQNPLAKSNQILAANGFIEIADDLYWASTYSKGIFVCNKNMNIIGNYVSEPQNPNSLPANSIIQLFKDQQNRIWICTWKGIAVWLPTTKRFIRVTNEQQVFIRLIQMQDGRILACAITGGVFEIKPTNNDKFQIKATTAIPQNKSYAFMWQDSRGRLWLNEELQKILVLDPLSNFQVLANLKITGETNGAIETDSAIWVCSVTGLYKVDKNKPTNVERFSEKSGLANEGLYALIDDKEGRLWMSHNRGISSFDIATNRFRNFTVEDGLPPIEFNDHAVLSHSDGTLWFGSMSGITIFNPQMMHDVNIKAIPNLVNILVNDKPPLNKLICRNSGSTNVTEIQSLEFGYDQNTLSFEIVAIEYSAPHYNHLKYKLVGVDADWVEIGAKALVRYPNLSQGNYRFMVIAANSDGIWNETPRVLQVTIHPPFWRTWWFITLCLLATMALVGYIVYLRLSKIIDLQEVRIKLYENLHDDLGSRLMAIVLMVDMALQKKNKQTPSVSEASEVENLNMTLSETKDIASNIVGNMRRLVWATDPENDELRNVVQQMKTDAHILLPPLVDFNILIAELLLKLKVDGNKRYQMLSIVDEALNNIAKYAEATAVTVTIEREGDNLCQIISDNGKGFDPEKPREDKPNSSGRGLVNMLRRAKRIKGTLHIESVLGKGTTITLTFPLMAATFLQRLRPFFRVPSPK